MAVEAESYTLARVRRRAGGFVRESPAVVPALLAVGVLIALAATEAGFHARHWYAAGLFLLALLAVTVIAIGPPRGVPRPVAAALGLFAAYTAWSYLSITWADQPGPAWDGANRTAMYLVLLALFALWPLSGPAVTLLLGTVGLGLAGVGLVELLKLNAAAHPGAYFIDVRFVEPAGYMNANAALWTLGMFACLYLCTRREVPSPFRGLALGGAGLLTGLALLSQSRGWALAVPLALVLFLVLYPDRVRLLAAIAAVAIAAVAIHGPVLAVHDDYTPASFHGLVSDASSAILLAAAALAVVGLLAALVDRRVELEPRARTAIGWATAAVVAIVLVGGVAAYAAKEGSPAERIADSWRDFKKGGAAPQAGTSRFASGGTNRYDFWKVAWHAFEDDPLTGLGTENFQQQYLLRGTSDEQPRYPHSLELGVLSETGLPGALLLFAALATAFVAALLGTAGSAGGRAAAAGGLSVFTYWLLHGSVDWFWEFPALAGIALAGLGMACALVPRRAAAPRRAAMGLAAGVAGAVAAVVLALSFALPWLAELEIHRATATWRGNPDAAFRRLDRAADLNPLDATAPLTSGTIALLEKRPALAEREFAEALDREPHSDYALLELGALAATRGETARGRRLVRRAARLSPRDQQIALVLRRIERGQKVNLAAVNGSILNRARARGTRTR
ncbi:MAG TPA: O-antigen ligase family protein [Thermoleophilaceae bacterium]